MLHFVTATDGASACVRIYAMLSVDLNSRNEHIMSRGANDWMPPRGQDDINPNFFGISKETVQPRYTLQQQQRYSSTSITAPALQTLAYVTATVLLCSCVCSVHQETRAIMITFPPRILKSNTSSNLSSCHTAYMQRYSETIGTPDDEAPPFQLATRQVFQVNHIPKGGLVMV